MKVKSADIIFRRLDFNEPTPYDLLLLADPSREIVDNYLAYSEVYTARKNGEVVGVVVLLPLTKDTVEIKNVAVQPGLQGEGIGSYLIQNAMEVAANNKYSTITIATANSSIGQLYLYQKLGFELSEIKKNFFTENYTEPIYENGIQAKHLLVLTRKLETGKQG